MQYLLMIYRNEAASANAPAAARDAITKEFECFTAEIVKSGSYRSGEALQPTSTATTVRMDGARLVTTDGPFAETREQLAGYYLVEAKDIDEAISLAARVPTVRAGGTVEIRPIRNLPGK
jgi:hypothetical protein